MESWEYSAGRGRVTLCSGLSVGVSRRLENIKRVQVGSQPGCFSCWVSFPASFSSALVGHSSRDPKSIVCVGLHFGSPGLQFLKWGAGPTPLPRCIHSLHGFGRQTLSMTCFTTSSFPSFSHPKRVTAFSYYPQLHPPLLSHTKFVNLAHFPLQMFPANPEGNKRVVNTFLNVYKTLRTD